jgi:hypothetical protein
MRRRRQQGVGACPLNADRNTETPGSHTAAKCEWAGADQKRVLSREYPASADIQGNPSPFTHRSDLPQQFIRVRARPAFSPFQADDPSSTLVGRSRQTCRPRVVVVDWPVDLLSSSSCKYPAIRLSIRGCSRQLRSRLRRSDSQRRTAQLGDERGVTADLNPRCPLATSAEHGQLARIADQSYAGSGSAFLVGSSR